MAIDPFVPLLEQLTNLKQRLRAIEVLNGCRYTHIYCNVCEDFISGGEHDHPEHNPPSEPVEPEAEAVETAESTHVELSWTSVKHRLQALPPQRRQELRFRIESLEAAIRADERRKWSEDERAYAVELREQHLRAERAEAERDDLRTCNADLQSALGIADEEVADEKARIAAAERLADHWNMRASSDLTRPPSWSGIAVDLRAALAPTVSETEGGK